MSSSISLEKCRSLTTYVFFSICLVLTAVAESLPEVSPGQCLTRINHPLPSQTLTACPRPIDDDLRPSLEAWIPWTHRPSCVNATINPGVKFCVYTDSDLGKNGISIITRPEIAAASLNDLVEAHDPAPEFNLPRARNESKPYTVVDIPGKGKGVVATRRIPQYDVFMVDHATVLADVTFPRSVRRAQGYELLHTAADQLSRPEALLQLGRSNPGRKSDVVEDIIRTNSFRTDLAGAPHMVVFPDISRMNYACRPNAFMRFSSGNLAATAVAFRDIQEGEEINISYIDLGRSFEDRQAALAGWGFKCTCAMCTAPPEEIAASDERLSWIKGMKDEVLKELQKHRFHAAIKLTKNIIDLLTEEGLTPLITEQYEALARIYWALKDEGEARKYGKLAIGILQRHGYLDPRESEEQLKNLLRSFVHAMPGQIPARSLRGWWTTDP